MTPQARIKASTTVPRAESVEVVRRRWSIPNRTTFLEWMSSTDHKRVGVLMIFMSMVALVVGTAEALMMKLQLLVPQGDVVDAGRYNVLFTLHGITMLFLFLVPLVLGLASYVVPLMIGARHTALPRVHLLSFYLFAAAGVVLYGSILWSQAPNAGWTAYAPLSENRFLLGTGIDAWILGFILFSGAILASAITFIVTIHNMRSPGMTWGRTPIFALTVQAVSFAMLVAAPVGMAAATMLLADRRFGTAFFIPMEGGSALLWQRLFWFFGHPAIYVFGLPALAIVSEILPVFSRKRLFSHRAVGASMIALCVLGLLGWGFSTASAPESDGTRVFFMVTALLAGVPIALLAFNWIATMWRGSLEFTTAMLFAVGAVAQLIFGSLAGVFLALVPTGRELAQTYFNVAHLHYVLLGGFGFALIAGLYYWMPKLCGRFASESLGKLSFWLMVVGFNVTFLSEMSVGLEGMPNRIFEYLDSAPGTWQDHNIAATIGAFVLTAGIAVTIVNLLRARTHGHRAGSDPWQGLTLEWFAPSPPPENNFDVLPSVRSVTPMIEIRARVRRPDDPGSPAAN